MNNLKTAIIGPGSIGLLLGSILSRSGISVSIIDYKNERADMLNDKGITLDDDGKNSTHKIPVMTGYVRINDFDLVIVCVKSYNTEEVASKLENSGYSGPVMTLQNGYGNIGTIAGIYKKGDIIAGTTSDGANMVSPGHVRHAGRGKTLFGMAYSRSGSDAILQDILSMFLKAGFDSEISDNVDSLIWSKLIINVGINALTAIFNVQNGILLDIAPARKIMHDLVNEAWDLAQFLEIKFPYDNPIKKVEEVCRLTSSNFSSMNRDINSGRKTEIDYINGAIIREGKKMGIISPYNETVTGIIKGLEDIKLKK